MRQSTRMIGLLASIGLITACSSNQSIQQEEEKQAEEKNPEKKEGEEMQVFIPEKQVTMTVEGMQEERMAYLFQNEAIGFSTYVPENLTAEISDTALIAYAKNADGTINEKAKFKLYKAEREKSKKDLTSQGFTVTDTEEKKLDFSSKEYKLKKDGDLVGFAAEFKRNNQIYHLFYYYPIEYGDGFEPSINVILEELVWHG